MLSGTLNFTDFKYHNESQSILNQNIQNLLNTKDLISTVNTAVTVDYDVVNMSDEDANFFANLVQNTNMSMKDIAVIIKVNKDGSLMANFIPGDKAVEQYLRNNIASLRQRFDEENLSYSELSYSNSKNQQQQKRKKENDNE